MGSLLSLTTCSCCISYYCPFVLYYLCCILLYVGWTWLTCIVVSCCIFFSFFSFCFVLLFFFSCVSLLVIPLSVSILFFPIHQLLSSCFSLFFNHQLFFPLMLLFSFHFPFLLVSAIFFFWGADFCNIIFFCWLLQYSFIFAGDL